GFRRLLTALGVDPAEGELGVLLTTVPAGDEAGQPGEGEADVLEPELRGDAVGGSGQVLHGGTEERRAGRGRGPSGTGEPRLGVERRRVVRGRRRDAAGIDFEVHGVAPGTDLDPAEVGSAGRRSGGQAEDHDGTAGRGQGREGDTPTPGAHDANDPR